MSLSTRFLLSTLSLLIRFTLTFSELGEEMELGDKVYYIGSESQEPIGILVGISETTWSDSHRSVTYAVETIRGSIRRIYEEIITNVPPAKERLK